MKHTLDWKFWLTIVAAAAGVVAPIWLWRFDLSSRALEVHVLSRTALNPAVVSSTRALRLSYDGRNLTDAYSSVVELRNTGSKPILASDIEGNLEVVVAEPSHVLRAQVVKLHPPSLAPAMTVQEQRVLVAPLLLNPGDIITLELLTDGGIPDLSMKGRIAGVSDITVRASEAAREQFASKRLWITAGLVPFAMASVFMLMSLWRRPHLTFPWPALALAVLSSSSLASLAISPLLRTYQINSLAVILFVSFAFPFSGLFISRLLERERTTSQL